MDRTSETEDEPAFEMGMHTEQLGGRTQQTLLLARRRRELPLS